MDMWVIPVLGIASAAGSFLIYKALKNSSQKHEDYQKFAQTRGWQYHHAETKSQHGDMGQFTDPADDWTLKIIFSGGGAMDGMTHRRIEWHSPQGALAEGEAVLGIPLPAKSVTMLQTGGAMGQQILKAALKATFHALGRTKFDLEVDTATAGDPGGVVLASKGQQQAMDTLRRNPDLAQFRTTRKAKNTPIILRDGEGLKLRCPGAVKNLQELSDLVALGKSLRASL